MAEAAKKEIIVTTFAFHADDAGKEVMATLLEAADRGVKVKIIADGMNAVIQIYRDAYFAALAVHDNIEIKIYNPISAIKPWRAQYRMHDKYFIVDREMYLLGGRNTNNIFLGDYGESGNTDSEVFVQDTVSVAQLVDYFDDIWSIDECKTLKKKNKKRSEERRVGKEC